MKQKTLHIIVGMGAFFVFVTSGAYMIAHFPGIYTSSEAIRYQFRANHIYILMSALINLMAGVYVRPDYTGWRRGFSRTSTTCLFIAPLLLSAAFFVEPVHGAASRPLTFYGVLLLLLGVMFAHLSNIRHKSAAD